MCDGGEEFPPHKRGPGETQPRGDLSPRWLQTSVYEGAVVAASSGLYAAVAKLIVCVNCVVLTTCCLQDFVLYAGKICKKTLLKLLSGTRRSSAV